MSRFTVRVELHRATEADYEKLHEQMEAVGFSRVIEGSAEKLYHLPSAEYSYDGGESIDTVLNLAFAAASAARASPPPSVLVTQAAMRRWRNLKQV